MFIVVAYDIVQDRRRVRAHKTLKNFGAPVQYSLFECLLDAPQFSRLRRQVETHIESDTDQVAYYGLCESCAKRTVVLCGTPRQRHSRVIVL